MGSLPSNFHPLPKLPPFDVIAEDVESIECARRICHLFLLFVFFGVSVCLRVPFANYTLFFFLRISGVYLRCLAPLTALLLQFFAFLFASLAFYYWINSSAVKIYFRFLLGFLRIALGTRFGGKRVKFNDPFFLSTLQSTPASTRPGTSSSNNAISCEKLLFWDFVFFHLAGAFDLNRRHQVR